MSVERRWLHDLGLAEGVDSLLDDDVESIRHPPTNEQCEQACPECGSEELCWFHNSGKCDECGSLSNPCVCGDGFLQRSYVDIDAWYECDACGREFAFPHR